MRCSVGAASNAFSSVCRSDGSVPSTLEKRYHVGPLFLTLTIVVIRVVPPESKLSHQMKRHTRAVAELGPLKPSTYQVLLALGDGELHGYAIMQAVSEMTGGRESILPGALYAALARWSTKG